MKVAIVLRFSYIVMKSPFTKICPFSSQIVVLTVYVFLYGRIYLALSGVDGSLVHSANNKALTAALASQALVQLGLLMALPMVMEIGLERGFRTALSDFLTMQLQLASVFFTFSLGTKTHYFGRTILHGGKYRATGRGFVVRHERFADNYRLYSRSHFTKGIELFLLLMVYSLYVSKSAKGAVTYILITFSMWFLVASWLFAPFLFNPSGFEWQKIVEDWDDWNKWMSNRFAFLLYNIICTVVKTLYVRVFFCMCFIEYFLRGRGGIGVEGSKSWESWWDEEQEHLNYTGFIGRLFESILAIRFFLYQYGIVYHLNIAQSAHDLSITVIPSP
jgi:callose synthase